MCCAHMCMYDPLALHLSSWHTLDVKNYYANFVLYTNFSTYIHLHGEPKKNPISHVKCQNFAAHGLGMHETTT